MLYWFVLCFSFRALLLLLHGLCEHCLWYNEMAEFLNAQGIYVYAHDHGSFLLSYLFNPCYSDGLSHTIGME